MTDVKEAKGSPTESQVLARIEKALSYLPSWQAKNRVLNYVQSKVWEDSQSYPESPSGFSAPFAKVCADVPHG